jgi:hypothetical protein
MSHLPRVSAKKYAGVGDVVAALAQPIARTIDAFAHTKIQSCLSCEQRREALNKAFPFQQADPPSLSPPATQPTRSISDISGNGDCHGSTETL